MAFEMWCLDRWFQKFALHEHGLSGPAVQSSVGARRSPMNFYVASEDWDGMASQRLLTDASGIASE